VVRPICQRSYGELKSRPLKDQGDDVERLPACIHLKSGQPASVDTKVDGIFPLAHPVPQAGAPDGITDLRGVHASLFRICAGQSQLVMVMWMAATSRRPMWTARRMEPIRRPCAPG
jgi:hypothetical protein